MASVVVKAPDTSAISAEFASGDIGSIVLCWGLAPGINGKLEHGILGPTGMLVFEESGMISILQEDGVRKEIAGGASAG